MNAMMIVLARAGLTLVTLGLAFIALRFVYSGLRTALLCEVEEDGELEVQGRFAYATTLYFVAAILFLVLAIAGIVWGVAFIWQLPMLTSWCLQGLTKKWVIQVNKNETIGLYELAKMSGFLGAGLLASLVIRVVALPYFFSIFLVESGTRAVVDRLSHYLITLVFLFLGLQYVGLGGHAWQLVLVASFAFTMGIKDTILDIFSGVWLLFERSVEPTHFIEIDHVVGEVQEIGVRKTLIATLDGIVSVPNRNLISKSMINWSKVNPRLGRQKFDITLDRSIPVVKVKEAVEEVVRAESRIYNMPQTQFTLRSFSSLGATYQINLAIKRKYFFEQASVLHDCKVALYQKLLS